MSKYNKALEELLCCDYAYYGEYGFILKEAVEKAIKYDKIAEIEKSIDISVEQMACLMKVAKYKKYSIKIYGKIYECDGIYVNNIYWNDDPQDIYLSVSTNNKELQAKGIYDVKLFIGSYKKTWWLREDKSE